MNSPAIAAVTVWTSGFIPTQYFARKDRFIFLSARLRKFAGTHAIVAPDPGKMIERLCPDFIAFGGRMLIPGLYVFCRWCLRWLAAGESQCAIFIYCVQSRSKSRRCTQEYRHAMPCCRRIWETSVPRSHAVQLEDGVYRVARRRRNAELFSERTHLARQPIKLDAIAALEIVRHRGLHAGLDFVGHKIHAFIDK